LSASLRQGTLAVMSIGYGILSICLLNFSRCFTKMRLRLGATCSAITRFSLKWPAPPVFVDNMIHRPCFSAGFPHPLWKLLGDSEKIDHDLCEVVLKLNAVWSQVRDKGLPHLSHSTFFHDIRCQIKEANVPEQPIFSECHVCLRKRCASEKWSAIDGSVPCRHPCARPGSSVRT